MSLEFQPKPQDSLKKIEEAEMKYKGEQAMTAKQADASNEREKVLSKLTPEQTDLLKECNLTWEGRGVLKSVVASDHQGFVPVIKGTIEGGKKIEIMFNNSTGWATAKIDGEPVSEKEAKNLLERYFAIAKFQTEDSERVKEVNKGQTIKNIREKIIGMLGK